MADNRARLLPVALIASVTGNVIQLTDAADLIVPEVAAVTLPRPVELAEPEVLSAADTATIDTMALAALCPAVDTAGGLDAGTCTAAALEHIWLNIDPAYDDDADPETPGVRRWKASPRAVFSGTWTP